MFRELESGKIRPAYLIVGEEPFQIDEICARFRAHFVKSEAESEFNSDRFDGDGLSLSDFASALDTLPGLFSDGESACRLVSCRNFEKVAELAGEVVERHMTLEGEVTCCLLLVASRVDKRKAWYRAVDQAGGVIEVSEPADRDWGKWRPYFETRVGKRIESEAWSALVEGSGKRLAIVWSELSKLSAYVGDRPAISVDDVRVAGCDLASENVFTFIDDIVCNRKYAAVRRYMELAEGGENEIKMLAIVAKQFRLIWQCLHLPSEATGDPKSVASRLGAHPYFVSKVLAQARLHSPASVSRALGLVAEADHQLKSGGSDMLSLFLLPYFSSNAA